MLVVGIVLLSEILVVSNDMYQDFKGVSLLLQKINQTTGDNNLARYGGIARAEAIIQRTNGVGFV